MRTTEEIELEIELIEKNIARKKKELDGLEMCLTNLKGEKSYSMYNFLLKNKEYPISFQIDWGSYITEYVLRPGSYKLEWLPEIGHGKISCVYFDATLDRIEDLKLLYGNSAPTSVKETYKT